MIDFKSRSQAGQDRFVYEVLGRPSEGIFADIGSGHPEKNNNTVALEEIGWRGFCVDNDEVCAQLHAESDRGCQHLNVDSMKITWDAIYQFFGMRIDYLSLDVDAATLKTILAIPLERIRFKVLTVEHDAYRFGDMPRNEIRRSLSAAGYRIVAADVHSEGCEFEDWWVDPTQVYETSWGRFVSEKKDWEEILKMA